ncbi:hypothetical protein [Streptomyces sp. NPDC058295]|uniref:hypothetical protein n=1 Tax=Streptomyces sp. NPDC058295 TaxID=3346431 RepID=UPI0036E2D1DF
MKCETVLDPGPTLHNIRGSQGGCATCAERGTDPTKPGYLYLVVHDGHQDLFASVDAVLQEEPQLPPLAERAWLRDAAGITQARLAAARRTALCMTGINEGDGGLR